MLGQGNEKKAVETNSRDILLASSIVRAGPIPGALVRIALTMGRNRHCDIHTYFFGDVLVEASLAMAGQFPPEEAIPPQIHRRLRTADPSFSMIRKRPTSFGLCFHVRTCF